MAKCEVKDLSHETIENLWHSLEKETRNWKDLMQSSIFAYSEDYINKIRRTGSPARALIEDLISREIPLQVLLKGLEEIENRKAISIIERGR